MHAVARPSTFPLIDRLVGGDLAALLQAWRSEGLSNIEIADRLRTRHDVKVSHETVRRWLITLDGEAAAS